MGSLLSRLNNQLNNNTVEEIETTNNYKFPPKTGSLMKIHFCFRHKKSLDCQILIKFHPIGSYFSNSFIMGGERFDQTVPEAYLFGENTDLNWLGTKPIAVSCKFFGCFLVFNSFSCTNSSLIFHQRAPSQRKH